MICPQCGRADKVHRSHSRGLAERAIKTFTPYKVFRCHECNWRGWLLQSDAKTGRPASSYRTVFLVFIVGVLFGLLIATWNSYR